MFTKKSFVFVVACLLGLSATTFASPRTEALIPATVDVVPDHVFAPLGFDDNDNAQIVLDGQLTDTCYKLGATQLRIDHEAHKIYVRQQAFYYPGGWCAEVRIPYAQTLNLGILKAGQYEVLVEQPDNTSKSYAALPVAIATSSSPDDFLYAPITEAHLERGNTVLSNGEKRSFQTLMLNGYFSSSCMTLKQVQLHVRHNNVIEVLPLVEMERDVNCAQVTTEFNISISLREIPHGRYLLHIRSLNGQAINRIADL